jgi:DNA-binding MarR family transcriptional regulator
MRAFMIDPLTSLPGYVLRRASAATLSELNQRLAPLDLRHSDVAFLLLIDTTPGITQSEVGRLLDIQRANTVAFVARLEARNLIERTRVDGRSQALHLTPAGQALIRQARRIIEDYEAALLDRVPAEWRHMVLPILLALWNRPVGTGS